VVKRVPRLPTGTVEVDRVVELLRQSLHEAQDSVLQLAAEVDEEVAKLRTQPAWIVPTLSGTWTHYGSPYADAAYYKDTLGRVHLRGLVRNGVSGTTIFNLPAGFRPETQQIRITMAHNGTNHVLQRITLLANGNVNHDVVGGTTWVTLEGISFRAA
jgi:hypothetical protein